MSVENPRFPHFCRIIRKVEKSPLVEQEDYTPLCSDVPDYVATDDASVEVIYDGKCRCYKVNTTSDRGDIITSQRGLALPLTKDDWACLGIAPRGGDEVSVCFGSYAEYGTVTDITPANFHGTHILWRYGRN